MVRFLTHQPLNMLKHAVLSASILALSGISNAFAQSSFRESDSSVFLYGSHSKHRIFVYQLAEVEYVTNENDQIVSLNTDTNYLVFERKLIRKGVSVYSMKYLSAYTGKGLGVSSNFSDTLRYLPYEVEFDSTGKLIGLRNWTIFRDLYLADATRKYRENKIDANQYDQIRKFFETRDKVEATVAQDIFSLFSMFGKEYTLTGSYIVVKETASPFTREPVLMQGKLQLEKPEGTKNTITAKGSWETDSRAEEKMKDDYQRIALMLNPDGVYNQLNQVRLTSETTLYYNKVQTKAMSYKLADVVLMNSTTKARLRTFQLWDLVD
ncbi:MAG: hypothetical protein KJS92_10150 [Bacteroidetes bacterium]|nr:hypothetical protein [Bacteroidota bacterium]